MADNGIYTAEMGDPPVEEDGKSIKPPYVKPFSNKIVPPKAATSKATPKATPPKKSPLDKGVYTADKGQPPREMDAGVFNEKPVKKARGGSISSASSRADGCATKGKTKGRMVMCGGGMARGR